MNKLYASPLRVYLLLGVLALVGIYCGLKLPVSLFPNSAKPEVVVNISYGDSTTEEFLNTYGLTIESQLHSIRTEGAEISQVRAYYRRESVRYELEFNWGTPPREALKEVQLLVNSFAARLPLEMRDSVSVWSNSENSGFLAVSFYSPTRSLDDLYNLLEPVLIPPVAKVADAQEPELWNPTRKEIRVELNPEKLASLQLFPRDIADSITTSLSGHNGGSVTIGTRQYNVAMPRAVNTVDDLNRSPVTTPSGQQVHLSDVAKIDFGPNSASARSFKTSGAPSLILFADPRPGGNVKRMAEDILAAVNKVMPTLPKDIQYRILVDPSEFIRAAINNVFHEVLIGALLAVLVLFLFIGSFRNTITAAIEIPLSMVLAFILMRFSGMNLNLISLGGLALSAGMNVDASVVVMENIFRHFDDAREKSPEKSNASLDFEAKLKIIVQAVREVRFAVIASTVASLVVFLPLAFTSDLSYAILGDLAKTVVFSHGFSAFVALILVPTVRLHLMSRGGEKHFQSPIDSSIRWLENTYIRLLSVFIKSRPAKLIAVAGATSALLLLLFTVLPNLPKEVIGTPDTEWTYLSINTSGNTLTKQMESQVEEIESQLLTKFGPRILYTFTQIQGPNNASIMSRLKDKNEMMKVWKDMEAYFTNTPFVKYDVHSWNPAELPIPDPPQLRITVRDGEVGERSRIADELQELIEQKQVFPHSWTDPDSGYRENIVIRPRTEQWAALQKGKFSVLPADLADLSRVATSGRRVGRLQIDGKLTDINIRFPQDYIRTAEEISSLPLGVGSRLLPLKALAQVGLEAVPPTVYREDERGLFVVWGKENHDEKSKGPADLAKMHVLIDQWQKKQAEKPLTVATPAVSFEDAEKELHEALHQLGGAVGLSILLIFLTLVIQFGDIVNALLVLVAVPLGIIGVLVSLFVFRSTLSLNSILGVILLNGIAVANSIILVDFLKRLVDRGLTPFEAAIEAGKKRLRPILITSLTTILGMLPIALGLGQGGRILQPLGIAVSGGLWVSMGLTLFAVPALQVAYLEWRAAR